MKSIRSDQYLYLLQSFGLSLSTATGGSQPSYIRQCVVKKQADFYTLAINDGTDIVFLAPSLFIETVKATEDSLKVQLFS